MTTIIQPTEISESVTAETVDEHTISGTSPEKEPEKSLVNCTSATSFKTKAKFVYDPTKMPLRFLFANKDGLSVTVECLPADTVGEVKGALLSVWPDELASCSDGGSIRLICMGKGVLMPDTRTLEACQVPVFKTHATPINVAVRPAKFEPSNEKQRSFISNGYSPNNASNRASASRSTTTQGCACIIL